MFARIAPRTCCSGKRFLGANDWYVDGAELLLETQEKDGAWRRGLRTPNRGMGAGAYPDPLVETCFAILFLKRATLRPRSPLLGR